MFFTFLREKLYFIVFSRGIVAFDWTYHFSHTWKNIVRNCDWTYHFFSRSSGWLELIYDLCMHCTGGTWHCITKNWDTCGVALHYHPTPQYFLHHSKKLLSAIITGLDTWKRAIWKLQNKYQLRVCVINATINTLMERLHRDTKILMLSSSVVCLSFTI